MKRFLLILLGIIGLGVAALALFLRFGLGVTSPAAVFDVAGGMAAKLGCSARYVTGLAPAQVKEDLASYAVFYGLVSITNKDSTKSDGPNNENAQVVARLPPGSEHSATYRQGLGCSLDIGDTKPLDALKPAAWPQPAGDALTNTGTANQLLQEQLTSDNKAGLNTRAFALMQNGELIGEAHAEGFEPNTMHLGWSMGKSVIAILFGRLEMQSGISASRSNLFSEWADERSAISLENMLRMTSGLEFEEVYAPGSDATRMLFNTHSAASVALNKPLGRPPGTHFAYSSGTTNVLARFLSESLGGPDKAYQFLHRELLVPLDLAHTLVEPDPSGVFVGSSYVYASARDWAKMGQLLVGGGEYQGKRLLSADWVNRATSPNSSENEPRYGYQLWLNQGGDELRWPDVPADAFAMQGNRDQIVLMIPSRNLVVVRLGWTSSAYPYNDTFKTLLNNLPES